MICSRCWASVPAGLNKCPRCAGAAPAGAPATFFDMLKAYPWLIVLLTLSAMVTLWAATRRPPRSEPIPPAVEPVIASPAPAAEPEPEPAPTFTPMPVPAPVSEPSAPPSPLPPRHTVSPSQESSPIGRQRPDGTWEFGPGAPVPGGR